MDGRDIQINSKPEKVVAQEGSKSVFKEKGKCICANAKGTFYPPVLILKGVQKNNLALEGTLAGSDLYMNKQSSFINFGLVLKWIKEILVPRKSDVYVILILYNHTSYCNNVEVLEFQ